MKNNRWRSRAVVEAHLIKDVVVNIEGLGKATADLFLDNGETISVVYGKNSVMAFDDGVGFVRKGDYYVNEPYFFKGKFNDRWSVKSIDDLQGEYEAV